MQRAALLLILVVAAAIAIDLPTFPDQFQTQIEVNDLIRNSTSRREEYYDYINNKFRFDRWNSHEHRTEILDFNQRIRYEVVNSVNCTVHYINQSFVADSSDGTSLHLRNASSIFEFGPEYGYVHQDGVFQVRGILCDAWTAPITQTFDFRGETITLDYTITYYFSVPEWSIYEGNTEHRVPIRAEVIGNSTSTTRNDVFHEVYDFVFWKIGQPQHLVFDFAKTYFLCGSLQQPAFPDLPDSFELGVEITSLEQNTTSTAYEYYDYVNNRVRIDFYGDDHTYVEVWDLTTELTYSVIDRSQCTVSHFNTSMWGDGGHLRNASALMQFGEGYNDVYQGVHTARGIPCDMWTREASEVDPRDGTRYTYMIKYYFSVAEWNMRGDHLVRVPIRMEVKGTVYPTSGPSFQFDEYYEYMHFIAHVPSPRVFQPPELLCSSNVNVPLPKLAEDFSAVIEFTSVSRNRTGVIREYYDYDNNRMRVDIDYHEQQYTEIVLEDENLAFSISDDWNCTARPANRTQFFLVDSSGHLQRVSTLLHLSQNDNQTYQGVREARGIPCDVWAVNVTESFTIPFNNMTIQEEYTQYIYFARKDWQLVFENEADHQYGIPIQAVRRGVSHYNGNTREVHDVYSFVEFRPQPPHAEVFVPRSYWKCSNVYSSLFTLKLSTPWNLFNEHTFRDNVATSLGTNAANVRVLHVSGDSSSVSVLVEIRTTNKAVADLVSQNVQNQFASNSLNAGYPVVGHYSISSDSLTTSCQTPDTPAESSDDDGDDDDGGVPVGGAVGLTILGLAVGGAVGALIFYFFLKKRVEERFQNTYQMKE